MVKPEQFDHFHLVYHFTVPLRDCRQMAFVMLNKFCPLSKTPPPPLLLTDNIKMNGIPTKIRLAIFNNKKQERNQ